MSATLDRDAVVLDLFDAAPDGAELLGLEPDEIVIDCFAGGGGASLGIEWATGRSPDEAINHSATALAIHAANHPRTRHHHSDVWEVDPREVARGRRVGLFWFSADCRHFSRAKSGVPLSKRIRALAHVAVRYAKAVRPRMIVGENVQEFLTWGPISRATRRPDPARKGYSFRAFVRQLRRLGYVVEWRLLRGCDFGAPTTRRRLFLVARCDGQPIRWPVPTHGRGRPAPWRTAAECIDFALPCPSIFMTKEEGRAFTKTTGIRIKRPIVKNTLRRIARGVDRFVLRATDPFIVPTEGGLVAAMFVPRYGERPGQEPRALAVDRPFPTIVPTGNQASLVLAFLAKHYGGHEATGSDLRAPIDTITGRDHHALVFAFLIAYYGQEKDGQSLREPLRTITPKDRFALVTVRGTRYAIADIGMRGLTARELANGQGFPPDYVLAARMEKVTKSGKRRWTTVSETAQKEMVGNSVNPHVACALVRANLGAPVAQERAA